MTDMENLPAILLSAAAELTGSESASLLGYDEAAGVFLQVCALVSPRRAVSREKIPLKGSVAGWVFLNIKPLPLTMCTRRPPLQKG
jgi:hypothetical protein